MLPNIYIGRFYIYFNELIIWKLKVEVIIVVNFYI